MANINRVTGLQFAKRTDGCGNAKTAEKMQKLNIEADDSTPLKNACSQVIRGTAFLI